jgi:hypothetical protein
LPKGGSRPFEVLKLVVDFAFIDEAECIAFFLVFTTPPEPAIVRFLETRRAAWMVVSLETSDFATLAAHIIDEATRRGNTDAFEAFPFRQHILRQHVRDAFWIATDSAEKDVNTTTVALDTELRKTVLDYLEASSWLVLEEVALQRLVNFPSCSCNQVRKFIHASSLDIVVVSSEEDLPSVPLMAIEFDGPGHATPQQQIKDELKDTLLADAGIPLLRVKYSDVVLRRWSTSSSEQVDAMMRYLSPLKRLVRLLVADKLKEWREAGRTYRYVVRQDEIALSQYGKHFHELGETELVELERSEAIVDLRLGRDHDLYCTQREAEFDKYLQELPNFLRHKKLDPRRAEDLVIDAIGQTSWKGRFTFVSPNGERRDLDLPCVHFNSVGLQRASIDAAVKQFMFEELAETVADLAPI